VLQLLLLLQLLALLRAVCNPLWSALLLDVLRPFVLLSLLLLLLAVLLLPLPL